MAIVKLQLKWEKQSGSIKINKRDGPLGGMEKPLLLLV